MANDDESLATYLQGQYPTYEDVRRRIFLRERGENRTIPDHHYRLLMQKSFVSLSDLTKLLSLGIFSLADEHLELRQNKIFVLSERQHAWQRLVTYIPPLVLQASLLYYKRPITGIEPEDFVPYFRDYILPNTRYTALPPPFIPQLRAYLREQNGFHDLHVHLNGSTETDLVWPVFLASPEVVFKDLTEAFGRPKVREQFEQESSLMTPKDFYRLLRIARRIRQVFLDFVFKMNEKDGEIGKYDRYTQASFLARLIDIDYPFKHGEGFKHPFQILISNEDQYPYPLAIECLMFVLLFRYMEKEGSDLVTNLFHFYLLILGLANRLLVQQTHQHGFEQFQKHTLNGLREFSEREYLLRFFQMNGNDSDTISFIEGRFSPKDTTEKNLALLEAINCGWSRMTELISQEKDRSVPLPELRLTAHFIKSADKKPYGRIRHQSLRKELWKKGVVISNILRHYPGLRPKVVGIDAAASEFDAPPEVFAPVFRLMRRRGMQHFTYHAGEDFHHILSGLRAVYEATLFTGLRQGDRIGHAVATGISTKQWLDFLGKEILIARGEWLDNLTFAYHLIISENIESLKGAIPNLANTMSSLAMDIYSRYITANELETAWLARRYCPYMLFSDNRSEARRYDVYDGDEWDIIQRENIKLGIRELLISYHDKNVRQLYDEPIMINTLDPFEIDDITKLQLATLSFLHRSEIVIETLPTSNVRIGHHFDFNTYHLWNWLKWSKEGHPVPPIVVGTDDTGIFATSIYNEYANIYCHLTYLNRLNHDEAMEIIERLNTNSRIYRFGDEATKF